MDVATKALISCAVNTQLIWVFGLAYAKKRVSHDAAHISDTSCFYFQSLKIVADLCIHIGLFVSFLVGNTWRHIFKEPRCEKTGLRGFRPGETQTRL